MAKERFAVTGMTCSACSAHVEKAVRKLEGVQDVSVNLLQNSMQVSFQSDRVNPEQIVQAVERAGYGAALQTAAAQKKTAVKKREPGGGAGTLHENPFNRFDLFFGGADVCVNGSYDGPAAAGFSAGDGKCP